MHSNVRAHTCWYGLKLAGVAGCCHRASLLARRQLPPPASLPPVRAAARYHGGCLRGHIMPRHRVAPIRGGRSGLADSDVRHCDRLPPSTGALHRVIYMCSLHAQVSCLNSAMHAACHYVTLVPRVKGRKRASPHHREALDKEGAEWRRANAFEDWSVVLT